jgi:TonB-dependent siderophore receptor
MLSKSLLLSGSILLGMGSPALAQERADPSILEEVVVTATRTERNLLEVPASVTVRKMQQLYSEGFLSSPDELRGVPGVFFRRGEGDNDEFPSVSIRGVTGNHGNDTFLALVDGIPFISGNEEVLLSEVPFAAVDQIEVVRGPVSALYGRGGIAGAVNYITRTPQQDRTALALSAGSDGYYRAGLTAERVFDGKNLLADVSYEESEGWRASNARRIFNVFLKGAAELTPDTTLTAYVNYGDRRHEVGSVIPTFADGTPVDVLGGREGAIQYGAPFREAETIMGALRLDHRVSDSLNLQVTAHARRADTGALLNFYDAFLFDPANEVFGVNGFESETRSDTVFLEGTAHWKTGRHDIVGGVNVERVDLVGQSLWSGQNGFTFACGFNFFAINLNYRTGQVVNANAPCFVRQLEDDTDTTNHFWSAFLQDEIRLTDRLTLTLGGRYDSFERETLFKPTFEGDTARTLEDAESAFSPKASLAYDFGGGMIYAAYGRGFSSNFGPTFQWDANQYERDSRPTTLDSYEIGIKGRALDRRLTYTLTGFYLEQKNRLFIIENDDPTGPPNLATTGQLYTSQGIEATADLALGDATTLRGSYTLTQPEWGEYAVGGLVLTGLTPTGVPEHMGFVEVAHRLNDRIEIKASYEMYGDYFVTRDNAVEAGGYALLNASARIDLAQARGLSLDLAATNLLDEDYGYLFGGQSAATYLTPGIPRQLRATLRARF